MSNKRLSTLDGLKGIAIISVMLTHMPLGKFYESVPTAYHRLLAMFTGGGGVGVTIFFIITGFLMYFRHPVPVSVYGFLSKRYVRLFPPFLVMVTSFGIMQFLVNPSPKLQIIIVLCLAVVMRLGIILGNSLNKKIPLGKILFFGFVIFQFIAAIYYVFYLLNVSSAVYYQIWPPVTQKIITFIINATLTLPFGQYIAQLDGVYWALALELLFYILYPLFVAPLVSVIKVASSWKKILLILSLFPFYFGLFLIGQRILGFSLLKLQYFIYFLAGAIIALYSGRVRERAGKFVSLITHPLWISASIFLAYSSILINIYVDKIFDPWLSIITVIPVSLLLITALVAAGKDTFLSNQFLTVMGKLSYALFLTHSLVIHIMEKNFPTDSLVDTLKIMVFSLIGSIILSVILYYLTEAPYFSAGKKEKKKTMPAIYPFPFLSGRARIFPVAVFLITFIAFRPEVSFTSYAVRSGGSDYLSLMKDDTVTLTDKPYRVLLNSVDSNLGIISTYLRNDKIPGITGGFVPFKLDMSLIDTDNHTLAKSVFNAYEIMNSRFHPFGFPLQSDSKGKKYYVEYRLSENSPSQLLKIVRNESDLISVYFPDKKDMLKNPAVSFRWLINKINEPLSDKMFWFTLLHIIPLPVFMIVFCLSLKKKKVGT